MILFWLAGALIVGLFLGDTHSLGLPLLLAVDGLLVVAAIATWRVRRVRVLLLIFAFLFLGMARGQRTHVPLSAGDAGYYNGRYVTIQGFVDAEPDVRDTGNNYVVKATSLLRGSHVFPITGEVEVHTPPSQVLDEGDQVELSGMLNTPRNTATLPYRSILANRGIFSEISFPKIFVTGHVSLGLLGVAEDVRQAIQRSISGALPEPEATMLIALLIGARSAQLGNLAPILIKTGLIHLIAISGIKIAIVAGTINQLTRRLLARTPRLAVSVVVLLSYWLVSGATVAGLRASIMWLLVFVAAYLGRSSYALVSLSLAVAIMLWFDPRLLWDTGFQLTTVGTAAIVCFTPLLEVVTWRLPAFLAASINTTIAAQIGVLPIQIASFHVLSPVSLLANALVLPFLPLTMIVGFALAAVPYFPLVQVAFGLVHFLIFIARTLNSLSPAHSWHPLSTFTTVLFYSVLCALAVVAWRIRPTLTRQARGEWLFGLSVAVVGLGYALHGASTKDGLYFVTNNDALIVCHGQRVLIDGGSSGSVLLARLSTLDPFPNDDLNAVIDTSPDAKNVAALMEVAQHIHVGAVLDPGLEYPTQTYSRWRAWLIAHGVPVVALRPGATVAGRGFKVEVLAPDALYANPKDGAGILLLRFAGRSLLYVGRADGREQQDTAFSTRVTSSLAVSAVALNRTLEKAIGIRRWMRPHIGGFLHICATPSR